MTIPAHIEQGGSEVVVGNGRGGPTGGAGPVERLTLLRPVLPCPGCAHAAVCAIRPLLDADKLAVRSMASPHEAVRIRLAFEVECDHFLAGAVAPEPAPGLTPAVPTPDVARMAASRARGAAGLVAARASKAAAKAPAAAGGGPGKRRGGRPPRHTDDEIEAAVAAHVSMEAAAKALGYSSGWAISQRLTTIRDRRRAAAAGSTEVPR
jgi:hypothetical protein